MQPLESQKEKIIPFGLIKAFRDGNAIGLIGSGLSSGVGFPSWKNLLETILSSQHHVTYSQKERLMSKFSSNPEWVAEVIKYQGKDSYDKKLKEIFDQYPATSYSPNHAILASLPFRGFLTTNYDHLIEDYMGVLDAQTPCVVTPFQDESMSAFLRLNSRFVLKIHGCAHRDAGKLVLTSSDYFSLMRDEKYERILSYLFQKHVAVSIGFGLADRDLMRFIEERYYLYGNNCPEIYAFIPENSITDEEINVYRLKYNLIIIPFSTENNYQELTSILLSLYCLIFSSDSSITYNEISNILKLKFSNQSFISWKGKRPMESESVRESIELMSAFEDPIHLKELSNFLTSGRNVDLTHAHYRIIGESDIENRISLRNKYEVSIDGIKKIAEYLFSIISIRSKEMTVYDKERIDQYRNTINSILKYKEAQDIFIYDNNAANFFGVLSQYFKQTGQWSKWYEILNSILNTLDNFISQNPEGEKQDKAKKLRDFFYIDKIWITFWQRKYEETKKLLDGCSDDLLNNEKIKKYKERLKYRTTKEKNPVLNIISIISESIGGNSDPDVISLRGQLYAKMALIDPDNAVIYFENAINDFHCSFEISKKSHSLREMGIQNYYLCCVYADCSRIKEARDQLAEIYRMDFTVLDRIPGQAWYLVAKYRVVICDKDNKYSLSEINSIKEDAISALKKLGVENPDTCINDEYY